MRALAAWSMRGRREASLVAVAATASVLLAWVGAAVVALVTLRRGFKPGLTVLLWALIPAAAWVLGPRWLGSSAPAEFGPLANLLGVFGVAWVLRFSQRWTWALLALSVFGVAIGGVLLLGFPGFLDGIVLRLEAVFDDMAQRMAAEGQVPAMPVPTPVMAAGLLGAMQQWMVLLSLLLARWWQAVLYNPGGFRAEFHRLRFTPAQAGLLAGLFALCLAWPAYQQWRWLFAMPLMLAGIGLVHGLVARAGLGATWLVLFYLALVLLAPLRLMLAALAVMDSVADIRNRFSRPPRDEGNR